LHSGIFGWDRLNWTISSRTPTSVTYKLVDKEVKGFPGTVIAYATNAVFNGGIYKVTLRAFATELTPMLLTQHVYLNLDAFQDGVDTILDHHLHIDASRVIHLDGDAIPLGDFIHAGGTPFDFRKAHKVGANFNATKDLCGQGCQGFDHCWIYDHKENKKPGTSVWSDKSGIRLDFTTDQPAVQVYTSNMLPNITRKVAHGGPSRTYGLYAAIAIEQQGYVDAINTPEFGVNQIYGPHRDFEWHTTYKFSIVH